MPVADSPLVLVTNPGADVYGSDLQMLESLKALTAHGWRAVVTAPEDGPLRPLLREAGVDLEVVRVPVIRRSYLSPVGVLKLAAGLAAALPRMVLLLRRLRPDALYVNATTIPWWIAAGRLARIPVICHVHEAEDKDHRLVLAALNAPLLFANRLILISETTQAAVFGLFPSLRRTSTLVRNGVPDRPAPPVPLPSTSPVPLGYAARLSPRKGTDVAVRATGILQRRGYDVTLEVAGSAFEGYEWYADELRALVETEGLTGKVTFSGYVSPVHAVYDRARIVLAPSLREPFGNAVVEAQLAERPVVAARAGGHLESIDDGVTGVLVTPGDPEAMADAVAALIDDPERAERIGTRARSEALRKFGVQRYADEIVAVVEKATAGRRAVRGR